MSMINNALSGALAAQVGLNMTSQNVANMMTPGYTRQGVLLSSVQPLAGGVLAAGNGVTVSSLLRFSDGYKSVQMWQANSSLGQYSTTQPYLTQLEQVMGDDTSNLNSGLDAFFAALNAASVDPSSSPLRQQVISAADAAAQRFNSINQVLVNQRQAVFQQRATTVSLINGLSAGIADLNKQIAAAQATGGNTSGLMDARDLKIDELSKLVGVQVVDQADGTRSVSLRSGQPLVVGSLAGTLGLEGNLDGSQTLKLSFAQESFVVKGDKLSGELGGLNDFENTVLVPLMESVTEMANQFSTRVNDLLADGYTPAGAAGGPLFEFDATSTSSILKVSDGFLAADLAFSSDPALPGDSGNLLNLIGIQSSQVTLSSIGTVSFSDAATQLVGKLAMDSQQNQTSMSTAETVRNQAEESWKSTSGVNEDEEAISLIQFQQMYQANMKVIAVANELFDNTLAAMG